MDTCVRCAGVRYAGYTWMDGYQKLEITVSDNTALNHHKYLYYKDFIISLLCSSFVLLLTT